MINKLKSSVLNQSRYKKAMDNLVYTYILDSSKFSFLTGYIDMLSCINIICSINFVLYRGGVENLTYLFNCHGGSREDLYYLLSILDETSVQCYSVSIGKVLNESFLLFLVSNLDNRYSMSNVYFGFEQTYQTNQGDYKKISAFTSEIAKFSLLYNRILLSLNHCYIKQEALNPDRFISFSSSEALKLGIIDKIIPEL